MTNLPDRSPATISLDSLRHKLLALRLGAVVTLAFLAAFITWLAIDRGRDSSSAPAVSEATVAASQTELAALADEVGHPVYWAGPKPGYAYGLQRTRDGRIYVRYLPAGVKVGDERQKYLTVATYPVADAYAALEAAGKAEGATAKRLPGGALMVTNASRPTSVYLAYPGSAYQVEVYDPSPARAGRVARREVTEVASSSPAGGGARAVTADELKAIAEKVGHPVFWLGPKAGTTYELTQTDGRIYIRYLPTGVKVGDPRSGFTTVGTYEVENAYKALVATSDDPGASSRKVGFGGLAVTNTARPTSVYLGYPRLKLQIEIYDPSPSQALRLVTTGRVKPVG